VNTARSKTTLDDFEAAALTEAHVGGWNTDIVEFDLAVAVGRVVVAHDTEDAADGNAGGIGWDEDDGLLLVLVRVVGGGFCHHNVDLAASVTSA
jgi:hypothetical protein